MRIIVNGQPREVRSASLDALLVELRFKHTAAATAVNGAFVPRAQRAATRLEEGDSLEVLVPMQGG